MVFGGAAGRPFPAGGRGMGEDGEGDRLRLVALLGVLAHDLRSPLLGAGVFLEEALEALDGGATTAEVRGLLCEVQGSVARLQGLADGVRAVAHQQRGEVVGQRLEAAAVAAVFAAAGARAVARRGGEAPLILPMLPCVADGVLLRIAAEEVLDNAQRHRAPESRVRVWAEPDAEAGRVRFAVFQEGAAPDPVLATRLFWRAPDSDGLGLGLAIAQQVVMRQRGWLQVEAQEGGVLCAMWLPAPPLDSV